MNLKLSPTNNNGFNFQIINSLLESCGVRLTWFDWSLTVNISMAFCIFYTFKYTSTVTLYSRIMSESLTLMMGVLSKHI